MPTRILNQLNFLWNQSKHTKVGYATQEIADKIMAQTKTAISEQREFFSPKYCSLMLFEETLRQAVPMFWGEKS